MEAAEVAATADLPQVPFAPHAPPFTLQPFPSALQSQGSPVLGQTAELMLFPPFRLNPFPSSKDIPLLAAMASSV